MYRVTILAGLAVAFLLLPTPASAQACGGCWQCSPSKAQCSWGMDILALDCACASGDCASAIPCGSALNDDLDVLEGMLREGKTTAIARFVAKNAANIEITGEVNVIVVKSCKGEIAALLTLPRTIDVSALVALLPQNQRGFVVAANQEKPNGLWFQANL